jgi:head-tail adaptor
MNEGRRRNCLALFETFTETDGQFGATRTWIEHCLAWVNIEPVRGREQFAAEEKESIVTHTIRGDYYDLIGVRPKMRMIYSPLMEYGASPMVIPSDAQVFQVLAVMPDYNALNDVMLKVEEEGRRYADL